MWYISLGNTAHASMLVRTTMKCEELLAALGQYVDGELEPGICSPFQEHLKDCNPCRIVIDNIRQTIKLFKAEEPFELPPTLQQRLAACCVSIGRARATRISLWWIRPKPAILRPWSR